jgi:outer membrane lipoprotein-sorting protein
MNLNHDPEADFERRLRAVRADDAPRPEHRDALRDRALSAFDRAVRSREEQPRQIRILIWGKAFMKHPMSRYALAACVVAALVWLLAPGSGRALAFEKIVEAVVTAKTARFHMDVNVEGQAKQSAEAMFLAPAKYRMEIGKIVSLTDFEAAKMLTLIPEQKQAVVFNLKNAPQGQAAPDQVNHFERLRQLLQDKQLPAYERLGEKTIDGHKAQGFRLKSPVGTLTLWGDARTGDPVRIENVYTGIPLTEVVMTKFEMNVELKPDLFALDVPKDFKVKSFDVDASKPEEKDFVQSLRTCAELSGGAFPDSLDTQSVMKLMIAAALGKAKDGPKEEDMDRLMKQSMTIGRGFQFALTLPAATDAHYAGKGVKKDTPNRPIFWYRPEGSLRYRVVDATLTARDADMAPHVEGAVTLYKKPAGGDSK